MKPSETRGLNPRQARAATLVAMGLSCRAAAAKCGLSERWVQELSNRPEFKSYVAHLQSLVVRRSVAQLTRASTKAVRRLVKLVDSEDEAIQLRASTVLLDMLIRVNEHTELAEKVRQLEAIAPNGRVA